jgi:hypothetical protein
VTGLLLAQATAGGRGFLGLSPPLAGLVAAALGCGLSMTWGAWRSGNRGNRERLTSRRGLE